MVLDREASFWSSAFAWQELLVLMTTAICLKACGWCWLEPQMLKRVSQVRGAEVERKTSPHDVTISSKPRKPKIVLKCRINCKRKILSLCIVYIAHNSASLSAKVLVCITNKEYTDSPDMKARARVPKLCSGQWILESHWSQWRQTCTKHVVFKWGRKMAVASEVF